MSRTDISKPLRDLLAAVATHRGIPVDQLDPEQYDVAATYVRAYECRGRVGLTGAGAWHTGVERRGGLLSG